MQSSNFLFWQSQGKHSDLNPSTYQTYYVVEILKAFVPSPNLTSPALIFTFPFPPTTAAPFSHLFMWPCLESRRSRLLNQSSILPEPGPTPWVFFLQRDWSLGSTSTSSHPSNLINLSWSGTGTSDSRVIHEAGVRHLLEVDSNWNLSLGLTPCDPLFNHVLQIGKPAPDVSEVFHRISSGARIPVSKKKPERGTKDGNGNGQLTHWS